eukprot:1241077-Pyramimonas_sp.AAC.1
MRDARRTGGPPSVECCRRVAPAPATLCWPASLAPPLKLTSMGHCALSREGGAEGGHLCRCLDGAAGPGFAGVGG